MAESDYSGNGEEAPQAETVCMTALVFDPRKEAYRIVTREEYLDPTTWAVRLAGQGDLQLCRMYADLTRGEVDKMQELAGTLRKPEFSESAVDLMAAARSLDEMMTEANMPNF
ncbi:hypothetical protein ACFL1B_03550 [Nanoarchaeota archaeon]